MDVAARNRETRSGRNMVPVRGKRNSIFKVGHRVYILIAAVATAG